MSDLMQAEYWVTKDGRQLRLMDMEPGHRRNLLRFLRRRAASTKARYDAALSNAIVSTSHTVIGVMGGQDIEVPVHDDEMSDAVSDMFDRQLNTPPAVWLESLPLVRELARLVAMDETTETESE